MTAAARVSASCARYSELARNVTASGAAPASVPTRLTTVAASPTSSHPNCAASCPRVAAINHRSAAALSRARGGSRWCGGRRLQHRDHRVGDVDGRARENDGLIGEQQVELLLARVLLR